MFISFGRKKTASVGGRIDGVNGDVVVRDDVVVLASDNV